MPDRIQTCRAQGWRMPPNTVSVARPTIWGNPFSIRAARASGVEGTDEQIAGICVESFRVLLTPYGHDIFCFHRPDLKAGRARILARQPELRGKHLACWCKPGCPCHADVLMEMANDPPHPLA